MTRRQFLCLITPLLLVLLGYVSLTILERAGVTGTPPWDAEFARYVRDVMGEEYAYGLGDERRRQAAYFNAQNAYVRTFDHYAEVVPPWNVPRRREHSSGQYFGIGVRIRLPADGEGPVEAVEFTGVKPGGPAHRAGVRVGDSVIGVDGVTVAELCPDRDLQGLEHAIKGRRGTIVALRLRAPGGAEREVRIVRDAIDEGSVHGVRFVDEEHRIGYARISQFRLDTVAALRASVQKLLKQEMRALVLDLRMDSGGYLDQAVGVVDLFLSEGDVVRVVGRGRRFPQIHRASPDTTLAADLPMAVLVDDRSASASEVIAGAFQDHRRAVLVGEATYGKFTVQTTEEVPTEFGTVIFKRTIAIYETPLGHHYPRTAPDHEFDPLAGLQPDLRVPLPLEMRKRLAEVFDAEAVADWNPGQEVDRSGLDDRQLAAAVALLKGETYYPRIAGSE